MKHNLLKSVILSVILLMGVSNAWAYNFGDNNGNNQVTIWFDNSTTQLSEIEIYFWQSTGHNVDWAFTHISGTDYWYINTNFANFAGFKIHGKPKDSTDEWGWETNERHDEVHSGWYARCVSPNSADKGSEITWTIPGLKNVNFINTTTAENVLAGAGTNSNPYIIKPATNITVKLTGDLIDNQCSKSYKFGTSNASTTQTYTVNSSATAGSAYNIEGFTGATRDTYTSRYASAGTLYFKTAYNISASVNGGHGTVAITNGGEYVYQGNTTFQLTATPEDGYEIDTWTISGGTKTGTGNTITINATNSSNVSVVVKFKAITSTVTLNPQSGTGGTTSVTATYGAAMPAITKPTRTGYTFNGYYDAASGGTQYYKADGSSARTWDKTTATTLYAQWTPITYSVIFNGNGSTSGSMSDQSFTYDEAAKALTTNAFKKTGYTFARWNTAADGSGTSYADKATVRNLTTTNNATISLYAQWTENKFDVTIGTDGNGTTTNSGIQQVGIVGIRVTATPNSGYKFKNWTRTGNVTIADANNASTTITATGTGSVTANFEKVNRIYLKPAGDNNWANGNPRYAVYVIDDQSWHDMTKINNDIYYCDINPTYQQVIFCRMNPENSANDWGSRWTQTEDLTLPDNCNMFDIAKDASTENYDRPSGTWMEYNAWHLAGAFNAWAPCGQTVKEQGNTLTFTQHLEAGNTYEFKFVHNGEWYGNNGTMVRGGDQVHDGGWTMSTSENNCKITADVAGEYIFTFNASTKKLTVQYPMIITLGKSKFGPYGITYNGKSYFSKDNEDVTVIVPHGATITFIEGQPYSNLYTGDIMQSEPAAKKNRENPLNYTQPFTVTENVRFDPNYVTNVTQVAYLGVPNNKTFTDPNDNKIVKPFWTKAGDNGNLIWTQDGYGTIDMYENVHLGTIKFTVNNVTYYQFTIPAGVNGIQFQHKPLTNKTEPNKESDKCQTPWTYYPVLSNNINCYTLSHFDNYLSDNEPRKEKYIGYWDALPANVGDYRLLYVDQVVEKGTGNDSWKTKIRRTYEHPSDVVRKSDTGRDVVSLHIFTKHENPEVILQQYKTVEGVQKWVDIEAHMVNGPLEAEPGMAMLPGRKKAAEGSDCDDFVYDDGIDIIKNDGTDAGCGVWDFTIVQNGSTATLDLTEDGLKRYTGKYYIRTSSADGKWDNFRIPANEINLSHYASENFRLDNPDFVENEYFTHYFCKWVDKTKTANVKFIIANDHGIAISREFKEDAFTTDGGDLAGENANVRFAWNQITNTCKRAYIAGSFGDNEFLVVQAADNNKVTIQNNTNGKYGYFNDNTNWLYYADVKAKPEATVRVVAKYNEKKQYFMGGKDGGENPFEQLIGGNAENDDTSYPIRIMYEFPEHRFVVAYVPNSEIQGDVAIETPVMLIRKNHNEASQITFSDKEKSITAPLPAYGTITFTEDFLKDNEKTIYEKCLYWISFPFDVNIKDAFGLGKYGEDWIIEYYDGEARSIKGLTSYNTYWEYNWNEDYVLEAGKGYVLCLDLDKVLSYFLDGDNPNEEISLYFPSTETIAWGDIKQQGEKEVTLNQHPNTAKSATDHNWHVIGVPSYANTGETTQQDNTAFLYKYQAKDDSYIPASSTGMIFQSMHAYMVQYADTIKWDTYIAPEIQAIAARKNNGEQEKHALRLELSQRGKYNDQTFVTLQDDNATTKFDLNTDLPKIINVGANIYSIISEEKIKLAGSVMPIQETIIPLGVVSAATGEYTFAMPDGTDGIVVELVDYETNARTNLMLDNYTINLPKGTFETRFALHVMPDKTVTSLEDITSGSDSQVRKFIIDGVLYMQKDGTLYDAQGRCVR